MPRSRRCCFAPLVIAALRGAAPPAVLFAVGAAYWGFGMATGPAWNAWVGTIVPARLRARFFARRARLAQLALLIGIAAGGYGLELGKQRGQVFIAFAALFVAAGLARLVSSRFLASMSEPPGLASRLEAIHAKGVLRQLRGTDAGRCVAWLLAMQVVVNVAAPFFAPYMLGPLGLSYDGFMLLTATSFVSRVVVLPLLGRLAERGRAARLLRIGALGIVPLPALWLVSDDFTYLLVLQAFAGCAWAAVELATLLVFFDGLEQETRTSVLALYNVGQRRCNGARLATRRGALRRARRRRFRLRRALRRLVDRAHGDAPAAPRRRPAEAGAADRRARHPRRAPLARRPPAPDPLEPRPDRRGAAVDGSTGAGRLPGTGGSGCSGPRLTGVTGVLAPSPSGPRLAEPRYRPCAARPSRPRGAESRAARRRARMEDAAVPSRRPSARAIPPRLRSSASFHVGSVELAQRRRGGSAA